MTTPAMAFNSGGDMFKSIFDDIASTITGRKVIRFEVTAGKVPYTVVQYLESVGVVVWPGQAALQEDGSATCNIHVREGQFNYAAGLLAGLRDQGVLLTDPQDVAPIRPRSSWGRPTRARGVMAGALRTMAGAMGASAKTPPVKRRR